MKKVLKVFIIFVLIILLSCNHSFYSKVFADGEEEGKTIDDIFGEADAFLETDTKDNIINDDAIKETSNFIYNILLATGIVIAVITGLIFGIKFMISTVEEKANIKKILVSYFIGCIILFSAFGIWRIVIGISNNIYSIQKKSGDEYLAIRASKEEESNSQANEDNTGSASKKGNNNLNNNNGKISVNKITLNYKVVAIGTNIKDTVTLKNSIEPKNATDKKLIWEVTQGGQVVKVNQSGKITAKNAGTAVVRVSLKSNRNVYAECKVIVLHSLYENVRLKSQTKGILYGSTKKITLKKNTTVELLGTMKYAKDTVKVRYNGQIIYVNKKALSFVNYRKDDTYDNSVYESWLNNYNPSSKTKYLIWVNQGTLRLMIFQKVNKEWKIIENVPCSTGDVEKKGTTGIHSDLLVKDFDVEANSNVGNAIHVKWKKTGLYFGNTIHRTVSSEEEKGLGKYPASHGCPTISAANRNKFLNRYGNKLINSTVIYF